MGVRLEEIQLAGSSTANGQERVVKRSAEGSERLRIEKASDGAGFRFPLLSMADLEQLPDPEHLIAGVLHAKSLGLIVGPYDSGKAFFTVDLSCHVAANLRWHGRDVRSGSVVYVIGEGLGGLKKRSRAWRVYHELEADQVPVYFVTVPFSLLTPRDAMDRVAAIRDRVPSGVVLIVIDTLTRASAGANLNDPAEMAKAVAGADYLRAETDAAVLLVHHTGWEGERSRGAAVLPDSVDTEIRVAKEERTLTISCSKQRDEARFPEFTLVLEPIEDSLVLAAPASAGADQPLISAATLRSLRELDDISSEESPVSKQAWATACSLSRATLDYHIAKLLKWKLVQEKSRRWCPAADGRATLERQGSAR